MAEATCDCCQREGVVGVASSSLGAVSFAWCRECLDQGAEPEMMLQFTADMVNGQTDHLVPKIRNYTTWKNGQYISWDEWIKTWQPTPEPAEHA